MKKEIIEQLQEVFPVQWFPNPLHDHKGMGWFLLEINPLPPSDELKMVVSDIIRDKLVDVSWGQVLHSEECKANHQVPQAINRVLGHLENQKFLVAVHPGLKGVYGEQPIATALEPRINYELYPDHPHLNVGQMINLNGKKFFLSDSFCYTDNPNELGDNSYDRLLAAFCKITIWVLRHQIWLATREEGIKGEWIGSESPPLKPKEYPKFLNPAGKCRCGKDETYYNCHMPSDIKQDATALAKKRKQTVEMVKRNLMNQQLKDWKHNRGLPHNSVLEELESVMLKKIKPR
ncbi:hypothetical protein [Bacillus sp. V33-4]|uniref:hypothetical protein n=1 Tax=Bacillus sp. V33-4 TaxID=2054169 RepID=UPI000C76A086|nr:hypothetical protein [Bacillus sp. V33-4]PLR82554.1 hypothetical protein CVD23_16490 [Bacillus sp. V33-4]